MAKTGGAGIFLKHNWNCDSLKNKFYSNIKRWSPDCPAYIRYAKTIMGSLTFQMFELVPILQLGHPKILEPNLEMWKKMMKLCDGYDGMM